jgi:hypothetical protein
MENLGPYTNYHELNQDWFLIEFNKVVEQWKNMQKNFNNLQDAFNDLKNYVQDYFKNLDVQNEINDKLNDMIADGSFERIFGTNVMLLSTTNNIRPLKLTKIKNININNNNSYQGLTSDGTFFYVFYTDGSKSYLQKLTMTLDIVLTKEIEYNPHGNSLEFNDDKLYLASNGGVIESGHDSTKSVLVFDTEFNYIGTMTFGEGVSSFGITDETSGDYKNSKICVVNTGDSSLLSFYVVRNNKLLNYGVKNINPNNGLKQGIRFSSGLIYEVLSNNGFINNTIRVYSAYGEHMCDYYTQGIINEIEDITKIKNTIYIITVNGYIYSGEMEIPLNINTAFKNDSNRLLCFNENKTIKSNKSSIATNYLVGIRNNIYNSGCDGSLRINNDYYPLTYDKYCNNFICNHTWLSTVNSVLYIFQIHCVYTWKTDSINLTEFNFRRVNTENMNVDYVGTYEDFINSDIFKGTTIEISNLLIHEKQLLNRNPIDLI